MIAETLKQCKGKHGCGLWLPLSCFPVRSDGGAGTYCRECHRLASIGYYQANKARYHANSLAWRHANSDACNAAARERRRKDPRRTYINRMYHSVRRLSRKNNEPCDIDREWIGQKLDAGLCEATGVVFHFDVDKPRNLRAPSIDRIDPTGFHIKENCRVVLWCINMMKGVAEPSAFDAVLREVASSVVKQG